MRYPTDEQVDKFVKKITAKNIRPPSSGDCWLCLFQTKEGRVSWGDVAGDVGHLISHVREGYVHGSLIVNAYHAAGYTDGYLSLVFRDPARELNHVRRVVKKYLLRAFQKAQAKDQSDRKRMIVVNARGKVPRVTARGARYKGGKRCK